MPYANESKVTEDIVERERAMENALYISDQYDFSPRFSINLGIRYSMFHYFGPKTVYQYATGVPKSTVTITDTLNYKSNELLKTYHGPEIRGSFRFVISSNSSLKLSYNSLRQYIHLLTNTTAVSPTDIWKLSDIHISPTLGDQWSAGFYQNLKSNSVETSVEVYYKNLKNFLDYKGGAVFFNNHHIETDAVSTNGKAYGIELLLKKTTGKLTGWLGYSYSRILLKMDDPSISTPINNGNWYPANFDKPHDVTLVSNYKFTHRVGISFNCTYSTGRPITLPIAVFDLAGGQRVLYGDRNQYRIPDYFRLDFSFTIEGNHLVKKLAHSSWSFSVYNLTGRKNPYSIFFKMENGKIQGYKLSVFGQAIPTVTYNFKF